MRVLPFVIVIAAEAFDSLKAARRRSRAARVRARSGKAGRVERVGEGCAAHGLDRPQRIGANSRIAGHGAGGEIDVDSRRDSGIAAVDRSVKAATTVDRVVAEAPDEILG